MLKKILVVLMVFAASSSLLLGSDIPGRKLIEKGSSVTLTGILKFEAQEWYLVDEANRYQLHFGNSEYLLGTGIELKEGEEITVTGFSSGLDIAVMEARIGRHTFRFRDEDGHPLWSGRRAQSWQTQNREYSEKHAGTVRRGNREKEWQEDDPMRDCNCFEMRGESRRNLEARRQKNRRNESL